MLYCNKKGASAMKRKLYGNRIEEKCEYCHFGRRVNDRQTILCVKRGAVAATFCCKNYEYDPLKRMPARRVQPIAPPNGEEFKL